MGVNLFFTHQTSRVCHKESLFSALAEAGGAIGKGLIAGFAGSIAMPTMP